jgi:PAS domain S-box-containing protein
MNAPGTPASDPNILLAFDLAPVGLCVLRNRVIQHCNRAFADMFGFQPEELALRSMSMLYPSADEFVGIGERGLQVMRERGIYADERIMKHRQGRLFWCHVSGRSLDRADPFGCAVWMFEDLSDKRPLTTALTIREREIAQLLVQGQSTKLIARLLGLSPRTIDAHRGRMLRKMKVGTPTELVARLIGAL